jgi:aspartate racemase
VKTIGLVGGFTWRSTLDYYRVINQRVEARLGGRHSAKLVLASVDFEEHMELQDRGGWAAVEAEVTELGGRLRAAGADFLLLTANTLHQVAGPVEAAVGLPVMHVADATAAAIRDRGLRTVGLLGTRFTMSGDFWVGRLAERHGIRVLVPEAEGAREVDRIIYQELAAGRFTEPARRACLGELDRLVERGAEGVVLGCTELPLLIRPEDTAAVLFDTLALHAGAAVDRALGA